MASWSKASMDVMVAYVPLRGLICILRIYSTTVAIKESLKM